MGLLDRCSPAPITGGYCWSFRFQGTRRLVMVCTIHAAPPIVISYLIDRRCLSSIARRALAPVCLHALAGLGETSRGELVCHRPVPIVISPMCPYCVWC